MLFLYLEPFGSKLYHHTLHFNIPTCLNIYTVFLKIKDVLLHSHDTIISQEI